MPLCNLFTRAITTENNFSLSTWISLTQTGCEPWWRLWSASGQTLSDSKSATSHCWVASLLPDDGCQGHSWSTRCLSMAYVKFSLVATSFIRQCSNMLISACFLQQTVGLHTVWKVNHGFMAGLQKTPTFRGWCVSAGLLLRKAENIHLEKEVGYAITDLQAHNTHLSLNVGITVSQHETPAYPVLLSSAGWCQRFGWHVICIHDWHVERSLLIANPLALSPSITFFCIFYPALPHKHAQSSSHHLIEQFP